MTKAVKPWSSETNVRIRMIFPWDLFKKKQKPLPPGHYQATINDAIELPHVDGSKVLMVELGNMKKVEARGKP